MLATTIINKRFIKQKHVHKNTNGIRRIEAEMRYLFYHTKCTSEDVAKYNDLEAQWKQLKP